MPPRSYKPCSYPGCGNLTKDKSGRCSQHPKVPWERHAGNAVVRKRGTTLIRLRRKLFARDPLCAMCKAAGRVTLATVRDHVVPLQEGGADDESNVQGLCATCHDQKSLTERQRGLARR